jgi:hypothetical protein
MVTTLKIFTLFQKGAGTCNSLAVKLKDEKITKEEAIEQGKEVLGKILEELKAE